MKKLILLTMAVLLTVAVSASSKIKKDDEGKVSYSAKSSFEREFKNALDVRWTSGSTYQKATFTVNGTRSTAFYDFNGELLGATQFLDYKDLPQAARKQIETEYKEYTPNAVLRVIARAADSELNDVGSYWVDLKSDKKQVYLKIDSNVDIQLIKQSALAKQ